MSSNQPLRRSRRRCGKKAIRTPEYMAAVAAAQESSDTDSSSSVDTVDLFIPQPPVQVIESSSSREEEEEDDESEKGSTMSLGDGGVANWVNSWGDGVLDCFGSLDVEQPQGSSSEVDEGKDTVVLDDSEQSLGERAEELSPMSPTTSIDETTCDGSGVKAVEGEGVDNEPEQEGPPKPVTEPQPSTSISIDQLRVITEYLANRVHFSGGAIDKIPKPGSSNPNEQMQLMQPIKISFGKPTQSPLPSNSKGDPRFANRIVGFNEYFNLPDEDKGPAMKESGKFMRRVMDEVDAKMEQEEKEREEKEREKKAAEVERKRLTRKEAALGRTRMSSGVIQKLDYSVLLGVGLGMKSNKDGGVSEGTDPSGSDDPTPTRPSMSATTEAAPQRREKRKLSAKSEPIVESAPVRGTHGYTPPPAVHAPIRGPIQGPGHQGGDSWLIDKIVASKIVADASGVKILYKVKWKYWNTGFNEWINENDFENFSVDTYWEQTLKQINDVNAVIKDIPEEVEGHGTYMFW